EHPPDAGVATAGGRIEEEVRVERERLGGRGVPVIVRVRYVDRQVPDDADRVERLPAARELVRYRRVAGALRLVVDLAAPDRGDRRDLSSDADVVGCHHPPSVARFEKIRSHARASGRVVLTMIGTPRVGVPTSDAACPPSPTNIGWPSPVDTALEIRNTSSFVEMPRPS